MKPSLGRIVHYRDGDQIFAAMIVHVHSINKVNLVYWDEHGAANPALHSVEAPLFAEAKSGEWFWPPRV